MQPKKLIRDVIVPAFYALYMHVVFKIILFKFGRMEFGFLLDRVHQDVEHPRYMKERLLSGNLQPFETITSTLRNMTSHNLYNLIGNIAIFMPLGVFLYVIYKQQGLTCVGVFMRALALSLSLEVLQVVFSIGRFDVDDLILNVFGGLLGYGLMLGVRLAGRVFGLLRVRGEVEGRG
ncbi:VanZ family protein [Paenibacillus sp. GCM10023248]|uniref:VanZ family protein n=1 Tax=Bacillales TaxID=1385 RepID=UPI00237A08DD|nr:MULTISPECIES: VanZ family protein [Bacillales]MDD9270789.1 VanZ family protein [Paenibacillus sp. MAHUQ-63]MDR6883300.1 glycopeptide antibiotics resistance protein [Bacillus sp. 3255]